MKNRKITIAVIAVLVISVLGLGIAFAAFSRNLTINGNGTIQSSQFRVVFEGLKNAGTLDAPQTVGTAAVTTAPTIKNNATEISSFVASLRSPGDSITYNFKIHNTGDYAATVSSVVMASGLNLTTNKGAKAYANTLNAMDYRLYYTDNNALVGSGDPKDCLEPGESENVTLRLVFSSSNETNTNVLPSSDLLLDNLGVTVNYSQSTNGSCAAEQSSTPSVISFQNVDGAYYTYETKSFIGTGVNNVLISEIVTSVEQYATAEGIDNGDGTYSFASTPAATVAAAYCTNCRLMTLSEAAAWAECANPQPIHSQCSANSAAMVKASPDGGYVEWWLADAYSTSGAWIYGTFGDLEAHSVTDYYPYVRPAADIPNTATMTGAGTQASPYVITVSN